VDTSWLLEHSETTPASAAFVWEYWTDVANWADPPASFRLEGPFQAGSRGMTVLPNQEPVHWTLRDVHPYSSYTLISELSDAELVCQWRFSPASDGGTRLTQRIGVTGKGAAQQAEGVRLAFEATLASGMKRIAKLLGEAEARERRGRPTRG
jgi:Polyketide cyclase / dehydrase and lipid transport